MMKEILLDKMERYKDQIPMIKAAMYLCYKDPENHKMMWFIGSTIYRCSKPYPSTYMHSETSEFNWTWKTRY